jgi:D-inositol-3-phosphate glycosyltransferase
MLIRSRKLQEETSANSASPRPAPKTGWVAREAGKGRTATDIDLERVALLWSISCLPSATAPFTTSGKWVAATGLTQALARFSGISHLDLYVPIREIEACHDQLTTLPTDIYGGEAARACLFPESDLAARLTAHRYDVLHDPTGINFSQTSYIRSRLSRQLFPITASQMGMSYSYDVTLAFIPMLMSQFYPCDAIVCSTQSSRQAIAKRLPDIAERYCQAWGQTPPALPRLELIPWGVDAERFAPRDQGKARRDLDLPLDRRIILCVSRLKIEDKMDWTPLLLAFQHVRAMSRQQPFFVIAGAASNQTSQQIVERAAQLGLLPHFRTFFNLPPANLATLYAASDIFVAPTDSPTESFGLTIIEAMASGRPVVASDWNGYKELIIHGETGFKVRTDWADCLTELDLLAPALEWAQEHLHVGQSVCVNVGQMAAYLTQLVENAALREEMGRRARARVEALYQWPVVVDQWRGLWCELMAIACSLDRQEQDRLEYLQPHYFAHFSHYPSRIVDDTVLVRITPRGQAVLGKEAPLYLHPWARGLLNPDILLLALSTMRTSRWLTSTLSVGELLEILKKSRGVSRDQALRHLMWLAKYDLVSLEGAEAQ